MIDGGLSEQTLAGRIAERLRDEIITGAIAAESHITINEVCERYKVSNTPVREAFRILEGEKLLSIDPYRGATISQVDDQFIRNLYGVERALEQVLTEDAMDCVTDERMQELTDINNQMKLLGDNESDKQEFLKLNRIFHNSINVCGKNTTAYELHCQYRNLIYYFVGNYLHTYDRMKQVVRQHDKILEAMRTHDRAALKLAVDDHLISAMEYFLKIHAESRK